MGGGWVAGGRLRTVGCIRCHTATFVPSQNPALRCPVPACTRCAIMTMIPYTILWRGDLQRHPIPGTVSVLHAGTHSSARSDSDFD